MDKVVSQKIEKWTTSDVVKNVLVYFINFIIIAMLVMGASYVNYKDNSISEFFQYLSDIKKPLRLFMLLAICISVMAVYFTFENKNFLRNAVNSEMLFLIMEVALIINFLVGKYVDIYLRPLALVAILTLFLTNRRTAMFMNILFAIVIYLLDEFGGSGIETKEYIAIIIGFSNGIIAIYLMNNVYSRLKLILRAWAISLPTILFIFITSLEIEFANSTKAFICGACSGMLTVALFVILLPIFEGIFQRVSSFKLAELTDHKARLINKMINEAPGTFNHSIVVSNIAEACAIAIDEDSLLARTCAYYHDIGKIRRPEYFKENQAEDNPHSELTPELSTNIIKSHTIDGYQLAIKNRLPKIIADVCLQHHGTMPILFFYDKAKKLTDGEVDVMQYSYSGPKPQTKIAAIIMIADGCEAATRSLKNRSRENVMKTVRKIVSERMELGQFDECEITIKELNIIIHTVVNNLTGVYHKRVEYPKVNLDGISEELNKEEDEDKKEE
ncbi:MAG: HDIG domain-containing protein [Clostridia bacterium]|nr:HDIG domain-containing protein [Clostridia bacterium]